MPRSCVQSESLLCFLTDKWLNRSILCLDRTKTTLRSFFILHSFDNATITICFSENITLCNKRHAVLSVRRPYRIVIFYTKHWVFKQKVEINVGLRWPVMLTKLENIFLVIFPSNVVNNYIVSAIHCFSSHFIQRCLRSETTIVFFYCTSYS